MRHAVATRRVLYEIPGMEPIIGSEYQFPGADGHPLPMAIYRPLAPMADPPPAVVIIEGYADPGSSAFLGCRFIDMAWSISMAQLIAARGMAAITYANRQPVLSNPFTFDIDGATHVADASKMFRFHAPVMPAIPPATPVFVVRSGKDEMPGLNASLDRFIAHALAANHPIRLVNHPGSLL